MKLNTKMALNLVAGFCVVATFAGCELFKTKPAAEKKTEVAAMIDGGDDASTILLKVDGKTAITEKEFNKHLNQMLQMNPYFRGASADSLPVQLKRKFFGELIKQKIILAWAEKNGLDQDSQFIKSFKEMQKLVRDSLLVQIFEKQLFDKISLDANEIENYFKNNKDKFVKEQGGVLSEGIKFDSEEKAKEFYEKAKGKTLEQFTELAKKENEENFQDFGRVSDAAPQQQQNFMMMMNQPPAEIKRKAKSIKNFPTIDIVKVGKDAWWVVYFADKKEDIYLEFDEVAPQIEMMLKQNKFKDAVEKRVGDLKGEFTLDVNEEFFKEPEQVQPSVEEVEPKDLDGAKAAA